MTLYLLEGKQISKSIMISILFAFTIAYLQEYSPNALVKKHVPPLWQKLSGFGKGHVSSSVSGTAIH